MKYWNEDLSLAPKDKPFILELEPTRYEIARYCHSEVCQCWHFDDGFNKGSHKELFGTRWANLPGEKELFPESIKKGRELLNTINPK